MNSKNTQTNVGNEVTPKGGNVLWAGRDEAEVDTGQEASMEVGAGKRPAVRGLGKVGRARSKERKEEGGGNEGDESKEPPECEVFSATDILVKHVSRGGKGAPAWAGEWREVFLRALARAPIVTVAARIAGVSRVRALEARAADVGFARRWDEAMEEGVDELEAAAFRSAVYGEEKPVYHQGEIKGWTVEYSHAMRAMLLKARRPGMFADKEEAKNQGPVHMTLEEFRKRVEEARGETGERRPETGE